MPSPTHNRPFRPILLLSALVVTISQQHFHYAESSLTSSSQNAFPKVPARKLQVTENVTSTPATTVEVDLEHDEDHEQGGEGELNVTATEVDHDEDNQHVEADDKSVVIEDDHEHEGEDDHEEHSAEEHGHDEEEDATEVDHDHAEAEDQSAVIEDDHEHEGEDDHEDHSAEEHGHDEDEDHDHADHTASEEEHDDHEGHDHDEHDHGDHEDELSKASMTMGFEGDTKPWTSVFWYTILVNLTTLIGVVTLSPVLLRKSNNTFSIKEKTTKWIINVAVPAFAAGALLTTAFLLILPESMHLIERGIEAKLSDARRLEEDDHSGHGHDDHAGEEVEKQTVMKFGLSLLFGFFIPMFIGMMASLGKQLISDTATAKSEIEKDPETLEGSDDVKTPAETVNVESMQKSLDYRLIASILVGDGFHNFADGIFIGVGFMLCSRSVAIAILVSTIYHELAQELADFFMLTQHAGLSIFSALVLNFLSGLTVTLGGLLVLGIQFTWDEVGIILSLSGGVYIYIAAVECLPRVEQSVEGFKDRMISLLAVALGAVPIGLVLLNHSHCD